MKKLISPPTYDKSSNYVEYAFLTGDHPTNMSMLSLIRFHLTSHPLYFHFMLNFSYTYSYSLYLFVCTSSFFPPTQMANLVSSPCGGGTTLQAITTRPCPVPGPGSMSPEGWYSCVEASNTKVVFGKQQPGMRPGIRRSCSMFVEWNRKFIKKNPPSYQHLCVRNGQNNVFIHF